MKCQSYSPFEYIHIKVAEENVYDTFYLQGNLARVSVLVVLSLPPVLQINFTAVCHESWLTLSQAEALIMKKTGSGWLSFLFNST